MNELINSLKIVIHDVFIYILIIFIIFDIITGTLKAFSNNVFYSKINKKGLTNHITVILLCIFFSWVFNIFNFGELSKILIMFYIASYSLSIIENLGKMGVPLPQWLSKKFKLLQEETNKGDTIK